MIFDVADPRKHIIILQLIILTDSPRTEQLMVNEWTRKHGKKMMVVETRGLFAVIFNDFGAEFSIEDTNGEQPQEVDYSDLRAVSLQ